ncbi:MAG TPA: phosphatase PAP2 family protein [Ktedonobacteraceae bacterium]|nr:phosphatase PAP2 family protein [Ktedonobacteraceae bacterium]
MDNRPQHTAQGIQQEVQVARRPWYSVLLQTRFLLGLYLLFLLLFGALAFLVYVHPLLPVDIAITQEFQENRSPWLRTFMVAVSYMGNALWLFVGLILLAAAAFWILRFRLEAVVLVGICLTNSLLNILVKLLVARPRPAQPLVTVLQYASGKSFPSGHVMSYVAFWGTLFTFSFILFHGKRWWRVALWLVSGLFVILVGPSRIYLGDHWASDVLGAYLLGGLWLWTCLWMYIKLKEHHILATPVRVPIKDKVIKDS